MAASKRRSSRKGPVKRKVIPAEKVSKDPLPTKIFANASPHSVGGVPLFAAQEQIKSETVLNFFSRQELVAAAAARLEDAGFEILQISPLTINIAGSPATYRSAFGSDLVVLDKPVIKEGAKRDVAQFIDAPDTKTPGLIETRGTKFDDLLEGVALEEPIS